MAIYKINPTRLYIKKCSHCNLKYFGKTQSKRITDYQGSGVKWKSHLSKHKAKAIHIWNSDWYYDSSIKHHAIAFSEENDIINSEHWANLILEDGLGEKLHGYKHSNKTKIKIRNSQIGTNKCGKNTLKGYMRTDAQKKASTINAKKRLGRPAKGNVLLKGEHRTDAQKKATVIGSEKRKGFTPANKGIPMSEDQKDALGKKVTIDGIEYNTYTKAAKAIGVSIATITSWSKGNLNEVKRRNGSKHKIKFGTGSL